jgi:acyl carrier protein
VADDDIEATLRAFLATYHPEGRRGVAQIDTGDNLWQQVTSLDLLLLVEFIETRFEIRVQPIDFAPQNFSSLAAIAKFVAYRRKPS